MNIVPESVVIVKWPLGWVAHIRYQDARLDKDISNNSRFLLEDKIDRLFHLRSY